MACSWGNNHEHCHNLTILKSESSFTNLLYCTPISLLNLGNKLVDVHKVVNVATDEERINDSVVKISRLQSLEIQLGTKIEVRLYPASDYTLFFSRIRVKCG